MNPGKRKEIKCKEIKQPSCDLVCTGTSLVLQDSSWLCCESHHAQTSMVWYLCRLLHCTRLPGEGSFSTHCFLPGCKVRLCKTILLLHQFQWDRNRAPNMLLLWKTSHRGKVLFLIKITQSKIFPWILWSLCERRLFSFRVLKTMKYYRF